MFVCLFPGSCAYGVISVPPYKTAIRPLRYEPPHIACLDTRFVVFDRTRLAAAKGPSTAGPGIQTTSLGPFLSIDLICWSPRLLLNLTNAKFLDGIGTLPPPPHTHTHS